MQKILYLFAVLFLFSCSGRSQKKSLEIETNCSSYPELNKVLIISDSTITQIISLPISLDKYLKFFSEYPSYQPTDYLISFLKRIEFEGSEYRCHILPFRNTNILPILLCICRGDSDYYLIVTVAVNQGSVIDHLSIGESTDNGVISFFIDENFNITQYQAQIVYNKSNNAYNVVDKEMLNSYQIGIDGKIRKKECFKFNGR